MGKYQLLHPVQIGAKIFRFVLLGKHCSHARDSTKDLQIFNLMLSQPSYMGTHSADAGYLW